MHSTIVNFLKEHIEILTKEIGVRRDLANRDPYGQQGSFGEALNLLNTVFLACKMPCTLIYGITAFWIKMA